MTGRGNESPRHTQVGVTTSPSLTRRAVASTRASHDLSLRDEAASAGRDPRPRGSAALPEVPCPPGLPRQTGRHRAVPRRAPWASQDLLHKPVTVVSEVSVVPACHRSWRAAKFNGNPSPSPSTCHRISSHFRVGALDQCVRKITCRNLHEAQHLLGFPHFPNARPNGPVYARGGDFPRRREAGSSPRRSHSGSGGGEVTMKVINSPHGEVINRPKPAKKKSPFKNTLKKKNGIYNLGILIKRARAQARAYARRSAEDSPARPPNTSISDIAKKSKIFFWANRQRRPRTARRGKGAVFASVRCTWIYGGAENAKQNDNRRKTR